MTRIILTTLLFFITVCSLEATAKTHFRVKVSEAFLDIRTGPGKAFPIYYVAQRGEHLDVLKRKTQWYKIRLFTGINREKTGWVHKSHLGQTLEAYSGQLASEHPRLKRAFNPRWSGSFSLGDLEGADLITAQIGFRTLNKLDTELHVAKFIGPTEEGWLSNIQFVYVPYRHWHVSPFVSVGLGYLKRNPRGTSILQKDKDDNFLQAGSGLNIRISSQYQLRLEYKHLNILTSKNDNEELEAWQIGLSASF